MLPYDDIITVILLMLQPKEIIKVRQLNKQWLRCVDLLSDDDWKKLYEKLVKWSLEVSTTFDWKYASICADNKQPGIEAYCLWSKQKVRLTSPWLFENSIEYNERSILINSSLRRGIVRKDETTESSQGVCIGFVYDQAFELTGIRETCLRRGTSPPCHHCNTRRYCLNQKYKYYIKKIHDSETIVNEHLCLRVRECLDD